MFNKKLTCFTKSVGESGASRVVCNLVLTIFRPLATKGLHLNKLPVMVVTYTHLKKITEIVLVV
jgi:hypothetical protein